MVCAQTNTATNLIEPKVWPLLWMEWQEILHEVGHPHLARAVRGWPGSASGTERSHANHGSTDGTPWPCQTRIPCHPWLVHAIRGWHGSAFGTEQIRDNGVRQAVELEYVLDEKVGQASGIDARSAGDKMACLCEAVDYHPDSVTALRPR